MPRKPADPDNIKSGTKNKGKFRDENYDRVEVNIKKGKKEKYKAASRALGYKSFALFVSNAIDEKIKRDAPELYSQMDCE